MRRRGTIAVLCLVSCGCGYVGDPQPPALNIPERVHDLSVEQVGAKLVVRFTQPRLTTEGLPLEELEAPDLRINEQPVEIPPSVDAAPRYEISADRWAGQTILVTLRSVYRKRHAEPSNKVDLNVVPALAVPGELRAIADAKGVRLTWIPEAGRTGIVWQILRRIGDARLALQIGTSNEPAFIDTGAVYGKKYEYRVRASLGSAVSETTEPVEITPLDTFPPATPASLIAIAGVRSIELVWERCPESDLRGYRVYRAEKGVELALLTDFVDAPAFSDRQVEAGKTYTYAVSAMDHAGNESPRSAAIEIAAQ